MTANWESLAGALKGIPRLEGALCAGRSDLFDSAADTDPEDAEYSQTAALAICLRCPALGACREWVDSLPRSKRPGGVVAGRVDDES